MSEDDIEIIRSEEEFQAQQQRIASLLIENNRVLDEKKILSKTIDQLNKRIIEQNQLNQQKQEEIKNWQSQIHSNLKKAELLNINYEFLIKELNKKIDKSNIHIEQEQIKQQKEKQQIIQQNEDALNNLKQEQINIQNQLKIEIEQCIIEIEKLKQLLQQKIEQLQELKMENSLKNKENQEQQNKINQLEIIQNNLQHNIQQQQNLNEEIQQKNDEYKIQIQSLIQQVGLTQSQNIESQTQAHQLIEQLNIQYQEKQKMQCKDIELLTCKLQDEENQLKQLKLTLQNQQQKQDELTIRIQNITDEKENNEQNLNSIIKQLNETINNIKKEQEQNQDSFNIELIKTKKEIQNLKKRLLDQDQKLKDNSQEKQYFRYTLSQCEQQIDEFNTNIKKQESSIQQLQLYLKEKENTIQQLHKQLENKDLAILNLEKENKELHSIISYQSPSSSQVIQKPGSEIMKSQKYKFTEKDMHLKIKQLENLEQYSKKRIEELSNALDLFQRSNLEMTLIIFCQLIQQKFSDDIIIEDQEECITAQKQSIIETFNRFFQQLKDVLNTKKIEMTHNLK